MDEKSTEVHFDNERYDKEAEMRLDMKGAELEHLTAKQKEEYLDSQDDLADAREALDRAQYDLIEAKRWVEDRQAHLQETFNALNEIKIKYKIYEI